MTYIIKLEHLAADQHPSNVLWKFLNGCVDGVAVLAHVLHKTLELDL